MAVAQVIAARFVNRGKECLRLCACPEFPAPYRSCRFALGNLDKAGNIPCK
jgi:hypothetical protein